MLNNLPALFLLVLLICIFIWTVKTNKQEHLNKRTLVYAEILNIADRPSATSAVTRGIVGTTLLGPVGLLAGISAKRKQTTTFLLHYSDGRQLVKDIPNKSKDYKKLTTKYLRTNVTNNMGVNQ